MAKENLWPIVNLCVNFVYYCPRKINYVCSQLRMNLTIATLVFNFCYTKLWMKITLTIRLQVMPANLTQMNLSLID